MKSEVKVKARYVMTHLEEVLNDKEGVFTNYINYKVLKIVQDDLKREYDYLVAIRDSYKKKQEVNNYLKIEKDLKKVKKLQDQFLDYKKSYIKRSKQETKMKQQKKDNKRKNKAHNNNDNDDLYTDYKALLGFSPAIINELFGDLLYDLKTDKYLDKYSSALKEIIPLEIEKILKRAEKLNEDEKLTLAILGTDVVKNKIRTIDKNSMYSDEERIFLNRMIASFAKLKPNIKEEIKSDTTAYYEIMESLIDNDDNFIYIKKLLEEVPNFSLARKANQSFVFLLLDKFVLNYKLKLANQSFDYVEPAFYKELLKLNLQKAIDLSEQEINKFMTILDDFKNYVVLRGYNSKNEVLNDIAEITTNLGKERIIDSKLGVENDSLVIKEDKKLDVIYANILNGNSVNHAFKFNNIDNYAFSLNYNEEGDTTLSIHILDTANLISTDASILELQDKNILFPSFKLNGLYPTLSFDYTVFSDYKLKGPKFSPSVVRITENYDEQSLDNYRDNTSIKELFRILKILKKEKSIDIGCYEEEDLNNLVTTVLSQDLKERFKIADIPFIYKKSVVNQEELLRKNHNAICDKLYNIPKREAHRIFEIIDEKNHEYFVTSNDDESKIELDSNKLLGIYLLQTIHKIQTGDYDVSIALKEVEELSVFLNKKAIYTPKSLVKKNDIEVKKYSKKSK